MRILLVEDDRQLGSTLKLILEKEYASVDILYDGVSAERRARSFRDAYDAIVLDLSLPEKSGFDICFDLRRDGITTPILVVSGLTESKDIVRALDHGADDYISKPFPLEEFQARVRALLRRPAIQLSPKLTHRAIVLDPNTRIVHCGDATVNLTPKEYSILELFMRHPDQVLTREAIIEHTWDFAFDSFSNVVDVHIKNIRKKLKVCGCDDAMRAVRGVGYRL